MIQIEKGFSLAPKKIFKASSTRDYGAHQGGTKPSESEHAVDWAAGATNSTHAFDMPARRVLRLFFDNLIRSDGSITTCHCSSHPAFGKRNPAKECALSISAKLFSRRRGRQVWRRRTILTLRLAQHHKHVQLGSSRGATRDGGSTRQGHEEERYAQYQRCLRDATI